MNCKLKSNVKLGQRLYTEMSVSRAGIGTCKNKKCEVLIKGIDPENPEFVHTNTILSIAVQKFIFETKRFPH